MKDLWARYKHGLPDYLRYEVLENDCGHKWRKQKTRWRWIRKPIALMVAYNNSLVETNPDKRKFEITNTVLRTFHKPITIIDRDIKLIHKGKSSPDFYKDVQIILEALKTDQAAPTNIFKTFKNPEITTISTRTNF
ncbi:hypothetical protein ROZALSC1DRAFT_21281 [Rozella allomycis CSF55]|uniref:Uncharacterized protein n=1 Tax=Rozella allomycis (strain CSF55) TaxID=988480 RepID=A0A4V1J073_ROZAC|nr:hypothetical protein ROZALSC1DRAFT_21281 [Rozella allomycis CSF55]